MIGGGGLGLPLKREEQRGQSCNGEVKQNEGKAADLLIRS